METTKKFNHAFTIAFSINSDIPADDSHKISKEDMITALQKRIDDIREDDNLSIHECVGAPYDTYENVVPNSIEFLKKD